MSELKRSQIFHPFRAIGLYCDKVPFAIERRGTTHFLACSIEKTFQIYNCDKLNLVQVGGYHENNINVIAMQKNRTFTSSSNDIYLWHRGKLKSILSGHNKNVSHLLVFGDHLISVSAEERMIKIWTIKTSELYDSIQLNDYTHVTCIIHPDTYVNKVLLGTNEGSLELWNIKTKKLIYRFRSWDSPVTCIEQSPAVDIVAIGLADGRIIIHNIKTDKTLFSFLQVEGYVTTLSFRLDGRNQLVSGSKVGTLAIWDLDKRALVSLMRNVHDGVVVKAKFFPNEPILLTSGDDNSLKEWIFDLSDGTARVLRSRSGHSSNPNKIRFYMTSSVILSAGNDRSLRLFSTVRDQRSREFSQGNIESLHKKLKHVQSANDLKLPPIISFDARIAKEKEWDNVITCHLNHNTATTWRKERFSIGKHSLRSTERRANPITAVCISTCGNFAIIGSKSGWIDKYNIQSGIHRGTYPGKKKKPKKSNKMKTEVNDTHIINPNDAVIVNDRHTGAIQGLVVDHFNRFLISGSLDGHLKFWHFKTGVLHKDIDLSSPINQIELSRENTLLAVVTDELVIHIFDVDTQVCVRKLYGHTSLITDVSFSGDSRWLASASGDSTMRLWDLPTGQCIDWIKMPSPIVSLSFSPRGDFLATSHVDFKGIYLWSNQNYFSDVFIKPYTAPYPVPVQMPRVDGSYVEESQDDDSYELDDNEFFDLNSEDALSEELITLSKTPGSKWTTLINLDEIKEQSKPLKPPEKPKNAPFLLTTIPGVDPKFVAEKEDSIEEEGEKRIINLSKYKVKTKFMLELEKANELESSLFSERKITKKNEHVDYTKALELLKEMSPSAIDFEIRSLDSDRNNFEEFKLFLRFILYLLKKKCNFEIAQSLFNVFLKVQGTQFAYAIEKDKEMEELAIQLEQAQTETWDHLQACNDGKVEFVQDEDIQSQVLEIRGENISQNYIICPSEPSLSLGIKLPIIIFQLKNMDKFISFEIEIEDDGGRCRRFRVSNFQTKTRVKPYITTIPLQIENGWNSVEIDLSDLCKKAYGTDYKMTNRVQLHSTTRLRRIFFSEKRLDGELPPELNLYSAS